MMMMMIHNRPVPPPLKTPWIDYLQLRSVCLQWRCHAAGRHLKWRSVTSLTTASTSRAIGSWVPKRITTTTLTALDTRWRTEPRRHNGVSPACRRLLSIWRQQIRNSSVALTMPLPYVFDLYYYYYYYYYNKTRSWCIGTGGWIYICLLYTSDAADE